MRDELIEAIRSRGYWRVNFRPVEPDPADPLPLQRCRELVEQASVSLRGWDYPHIPRGQRDDAGVELHDTFVQEWTDWQGQREFWRMYVSSQFLHYRALDEDWREQDTLTSRSDFGQPDGPVLGVMTNLWLLVEIFEFLSRLVQPGGLYASGVHVDVSLHTGAPERTLWIEDRRRGPFNYDRKTNAQVVTFAATLTAAEAQAPKRLADRAARHVFERFGWTPLPDQLNADIQALYDLR